MNKDFKIFLLEDDGTYAQLDYDTSNSSDFTTQFSITQITDISQRKDNISQNLSIPDTKNNSKVLGYLYSFSKFSDTSLAEKLYYNFSPNRGVTCMIYEGSILLFKGELKITEIDSDVNGNYTYSAVVTGALINLFGAIGDDEVADVFNNDFAHLYNLTTIQNSWDYSINSDFIYPSIDYGRAIVPNAEKFDLYNFRTGIYLKTYFDSIFSHYGYTYSGNFKDTDIFKKCYIPYTEETFSKKIFTPLFNAGFSGTTKTVYISPVTVSGIKFETAVDNDIIHNSVYTDSFYTLYKFDVKRKITTDISFAFDYSINLLSPNSTPIDIGISIINVLPTGQIQSKYGLAQQKFSVPSGVTSVTGTSTIHVSKQALTNANSIAVIGYTESAYDSGNLLAINFKNASFAMGSTTVQSQVEILLGDVVSLVDVVPQDVKVKDFLKSVLGMFNLYIMINPDNPNDLIIEPFDTFYQQALTPAQYALNWSNKASASGTKMTFNTQLPSAYNFKFKEDSDGYYSDLYNKSYSKSYGDFSIDNSKGVADAVDFEVTFSSTVIVQENLDDKIMPSIWKGDLNKKESYKSNLSLLYNNGIGTCNPYAITVTSATGDTITYADINTGNTYNTSHHILTVNNVPVFNCLFGIPNEVYAPTNQNVFTLPTIYNNFYESQLTTLNDDNVFIIELKVWLNSVDIANIDLRKPIWINNKNGGAYFKIISIDYYDSTQPSDCKLQKIIS